MNVMRPGPESEEFQALRRLLKLKRYEQPPPGFFQDFPSQVLARIRSDKLVAPESLWERLSWEVPWLVRLIESFQTRPALATGFGAAVCALLIGGLIYSEQTEFNPPKPVTFVPVPETPVASTPAPALPGFVVAHPSELAALAGTTNGSLNPPLPTGGSLFEQFRAGIHPQPVSFPLPAGAP